MDIRYWPLIGLTVFLVGTPRATGQLTSDPALPAQEADEILKAAHHVRLTVLDRETDVLKALRAAGDAPSPEQEQKLIAEVRKAYELTPPDEARVVRELRQADQAPAPALDVQVDPHRGDGHLGGAE